MDKVVGEVLDKVLDKVLDEVLDKVLDEVLDEVVGEVVGRSSNPIITTTPGGYYNVIYLHSRHRDLKSIFDLNSERQEILFVAYWWRISGAGGARNF